MNACYACYLTSLAVCRRPFLPVLTPTAASNSVRPVCAALWPALTTSFSLQYLASSSTNEIRLGLGSCALENGEQAAPRAAGMWIQASKGWAAPLLTRGKLGGAGQAGEGDAESAEGHSLKGSKAGHRGR